MRNEGCLIFSWLQQGSYALRKRARPLQTGDRIAILVGNQWVPGTIESAFVYAARDIGVTKPGSMQGLYFISDTGERCGLCVGMRVQLLSIEESS